MNILLESGYERFRCLGADCEATCCNGWRIDIDKKTYKAYKSNQHPSLKALFRSAIKRNKDSDRDATYASIVLDDNGNCPFMDGGLCRIHLLLGPQALAGLCATYPRVSNQLAGHEERSLSLACPEAARIVLLQREGMQFVEQTDDSEMGTRVDPVEAEKIQAISDIRALIIFILQYREVSVETRLVMLGSLLERMEGTVLPFGTDSAGQLPGLVSEVQGLLAGAQKLEEELTSVKPIESLQVRVFGGIVECLRIHGSARFAECVKEAGEGLFLSRADAQGDGDFSRRMRSAFERHYVPFFADNEHILENYLVHTAFQSALPFRADEPLHQYSHLVVNFLIIRLVLLGMAAFHGRLTVDIVIRLVHSFTRFGLHNRNYLPHVVKLLDAHQLNGYRDLFVLLAGGGRRPATAT